MAKPSPDRDDTHPVPDAHPPARRPRWVTVGLALVVLLVVLVAVLHLTGKSLGGHGSPLP